MTLLTTYHKRTAFARANRETIKEREDGYESLVSVRLPVSANECRQ